MRSPSRSQSPEGEDANEDESSMRQRMEEFINENNLRTRVPRDPIHPVIPTEDHLSQQANDSQSDRELPQFQQEMAGLGEISDGYEDDEDDDQVYISDDIDSDEELDLQMLSTNQMNENRGILSNDESGSRGDLQNGNLSDDNLETSFRKFKRKMSIHQEKMQVKIESGKSLPENKDMPDVSIYINKYIYLDIIYEYF